jgi:hypothetical protein
MAGFAGRASSRSAATKGSAASAAATRSPLNGRSAVTQAKALGERLNARSTALAIQRKSARSNGLPDPLRASMEAMSGIALDDVTVHRNSDRPAQMQAHAYARGTEIHLAPGQERHLPHEAWHVVQQKQGRVRPTTEMNGLGVNDDQALEREADHAAGAAAQAEQRAGTGSDRGSLDVRASARSSTVAQRVSKTVSSPRVRAPRRKKSSGISKQKSAAPKKRDNIVRTSTGQTTEGVITSIKFPSRFPSNAYKQGQHATAYTAFEHMITNHVAGLYPIDAVHELSELIDGIDALIKPNTSKTHLREGLEDGRSWLKSAKTNLNSDREQEGLEDLTQAIIKILSTRNQIPGTAFTKKNTGGHGEGDAAGKLQVAENSLRLNGHMPDHLGSDTKGAELCAALMWKQFDPAILHKSNPEAIAGDLARHIDSMRLCYPRVFEHLSQKKSWYLSAQLTKSQTMMSALQGLMKEVQEKLHSLGY